MFKITFEIRYNNGWEWRYIDRTDNITSGLIIDESGLSQFELSVLRRIRIHSNFPFYDDSTKWFRFEVQINSIEL